MQEIRRLALFLHTWGENFLTDPRMYNCISIYNSHRCMSTDTQLEITSYNITGHATMKTSLKGVSIKSINVYYCLEISQPCRIYMYRGGVTCPISTVQSTSMFLLFAMS